MKNIKRYLLFIVLITGLAAVIDLPEEFPFNIKFREYKFEKTFTRPQLNLNFGGVSFKRDLNIHEGLDLAGGTHLVMSADMSKVTPQDRDRSLESLKEIIERRVNLFGVSEPIIQTSKAGGDYRVIIELAGIKDVAQATQLIGKTAELTFRSEPATPSPNISTQSAEFQLFGPYQELTDLSGKDLKRAEPSFDQQNGEPIVQLTFTSDGAKKFEDLTRKNLNKRLAIFLDNQILMAPTVQSVISGGQAIINGGFTPEQTKEMAILLNSGALPAPVHIIEQRTIGATLGQDSINKSIVAGIIGLIIVAIFMVGNYGRYGLIANLALIIYILLSLAVYKLLPVTLTLAGIAGFILSIGMAVDANILIFERMKEEIRWGKNKFNAIELGFARAFPSIRDSNASSLITCAILYYFGTGPVRGFAVTLAIGILISLFTAINVTRTFLRITTKNN